MKTSQQLPDPSVAATKVLTKADLSAPPVDLNRVVALWPNLFLVEEELDNAGYLLPVGELGAEIVVNRSEKDERKRFTIAHELGHWVLGISLKKKTGHFSQPKNAEYAEIEKWCDSFAADLLMPGEMIRKHLSHKDPILVIDSLTRAASQFKVSEEAFFIRLWEVMRMQVAYLSVAGAEIKVERNFADPATGAALALALRTADALNQLRASPFIRFSFTSESGNVVCIGRRLNATRVVLVFRWP